RLRRGGPDRHDVGAPAAGGLDPELDDRRSFDDRVLADDDDQLGAADLRERRAAGRQLVSGLLRQDRIVRAQPAAYEPAERVADLDRLGTGERDYRALARRAQQ